MKKIKTRKSTYSYLAKFFLVFVAGFMLSSVYRLTTSGTGALAPIFQSASVNKVVIEDDPTANAEQQKLIQQVNNAANKEYRAKNKKEKDAATAELLVAGQALQNYQVELDSNPNTTTTAEQAKIIAENKLKEDKVISEDGNNLGTSAQAQELSDLNSKELAASKTPTKDEGGKASCVGGNIPVKDGQIVATGANFKDTDKRECVRCANGRYQDSMTCESAIATDPKNTILPYSAGKEYTGGAKVPKSCLVSENGNAGNVASGNTRTNGEGKTETCIDGRWQLDAKKEGDSFCQSDNDKTLEWDIAQAKCVKKAVDPNQAAKDKAYEKMAADKAEKLDPKVTKIPTTPCIAGIKTFSGYVVNIECGTRDNKPFTKSTVCYSPKVFKTSASGNLECVSENAVANIYGSTQSECNKKITNIATQECLKVANGPGYYVSERKIDSATLNTTYSSNSNCQNGMDLKKYKCVPIQGTSNFARIDISGPDYISLQPTNTSSDNSNNNQNTESQIRPYGYKDNKSGNQIGGTTNNLNNCRWGGKILASSYSQVTYECYKEDAYITINNTSANNISEAPLTRIVAYESMCKSNETAKTINSSTTMGSYSYTICELPASTKLKKEGDSCLKSSQCETNKCGGAFWFWNWTCTNDGAQPQYYKPYLVTDPSGCDPNTQTPRETIFNGQKMYYCDEIAAPQGTSSQIESTNKKDFTNKSLYEKPADAAQISNGLGPAWINKEGKWYNGTRCNYAKRNMCATGYCNNTTSECDYPATE